MNYWLYSFQTKEIQNFVFRSDKLKDVKGGSELINLLCSDILESILKEIFTITNTKSYILTSGAGQARLLFDDPSLAKKIYSLMPFLIQNIAPGLLFIQALIEVQDNNLQAAIEKSEFALQTNRSFALQEIPFSSPFIARNPHTGFAGTRVESNEIIDKQVYARRKNLSSRSILQKLVGEKFQEWEKLKNPEIDDLKTEKDSYIALIHADGNSIGSLFQNVGKALKEKQLPTSKVKEIYKKLSNAISTTTEKACQKAFHSIFDSKHYSATKQLYIYPVVIGGDDITIIIRQDKAFPFLEKFLEQFEILSQEKLQELQKDEPELQNSLPSFLTACAGVCFVKKNYPFYRAYELTESIIEFTKRQAKSNKKGGITPSAFYFHKFEGSISGDFKEIIDRELNSESNKITYNFGPYSVGQVNTPLPSFKDLSDLAKELATFPSSPIRNLVNFIVEEDPHHTQEYLNRILDIVKETRAIDTTKMKNLLKKLHQKESTTDSEEGKEIIFLKEYNEQGYQASCLQDAVFLKEILKKGVDK